MSREKERIDMKKKGIWVGVIILVVVAAILMIKNGRSNAIAGLNANLDTVTIENGSLIATIGATGTVRAKQSAQIFWQTSGTVSDVLVSVGSEVSENDVLATLQQTSLSQSIISAQTELINAQDDLEELYKGFDTLALASAQQAISDAENNLQTAQSEWNNINYPANPAYIDDAEASLVFAQEDLDNAKKAYEKLGSGGNDLVRAQRQSALAQAQLRFESAERTYNALVGTSTPIEEAEANANLDVAQAQLAQVKEDYQDLISGPTENDIAAAEARVAAVQSTLNLSMLFAPFDGTITKSENAHGDLVSANTQGFRLDDLSQLVADLDVSEVDINRIEVGQTVTLMFDAILGQEYEGEVSSVSPVGEVSAGMVNFKVSVIVLNPDDFVKPGMTAAVNIVVSEIENVLIVPNRAVRVVDGNRVVYILTDNGIEPVSIELGANSDFFSEIIGGDVEEGDEILLNPSSDIIGPGGGRGPGGDGGPFGGG